MRGCATAATFSLVEYKDLYFGGTCYTARHEVQMKADRYKLFTSMNEPRPSDDSVVFIIVDEFETSPSLNSWATPEALKK